jgi:hypothetical protein
MEGINTVMVGKDNNNGVNDVTMTGINQLLHFLFSSALFSSDCCSFFPCYLHWLFFLKKQREDFLLESSAVVRQLLRCSKPELLSVVVSPPRRGPRRARIHQ